MKRKREKWRLPKPFEISKVNKDGSQSRTRGEPLICGLIKHKNDETLSTDMFAECCDCGLTHHYMFNVMKPQKNGEWYLIMRVYRVPGTGKV